MAKLAESAHEFDPSQNRAKNHIACAVLASMVLAFVGVLNFPYDYVQVGQRWVGISDDDQGGPHRHLAEMPRMAGWPFRYWVQYEHDGQMEDRYWSGNYLVLNIAIGVCLAFVVYAYMQLRNWRIRHARNARVTRTLFDCGIALAILGVPATVIVLENREAIEHWRLARQLARRGNCQMACWIPSPLAEQLPEGLIRTFSRLRQVTLAGPDQEMVRSAAELPSIVGIHCNQGDFDASAIEPLVDNIHLYSLHLTERTLSDPEIDIIGRLPWLSELSLRGTNLDSQILRRLDHLDRLSHVDLTRTRLDLAKLGKPRWAASVETLYLTRPTRGGGKLSIHGWHRLTFLSVERFSTRLNDSVLEIRLNDLPNLKQLQINRVQKHHLVIHNTPRLTTIDEGLAELQESLGSEAYVPGLTWVTSMDIDGAESLTELGCYARDLEHLSIQNTSSLRSFSLGSFLISALSEPVTETVDPERCRQWIRFLGSWEGPTKFDLTGLPLGQVDLSPLSSNARVRELVLRNSGVSIDQIKQLDGMVKIERLDVRSFPLQQDELTWLLERFPNLIEVTIDGTELETFSVSGNDRLKRILVTNLDNAVDVEVVDVPRLYVGLRLSQVPRKLTIRNAPSIVGLAVEGSWPANAEVNGLRRLEWFAGGGEAIDDELADVLLQCDELDQLTLAYPSISREKLKEIGQLHKLSLLALPGADVDDEITANWHALKSLWEINLDDTSVSVGTIAWLSRIESLRRVSLNRVRLSRAAADALGQMSQLGELYLSGTRVDPISLRPLFEEGNLDSLDLSGWPVDEALVQVLEQADSLQHLVLHDAQIDEASLQRLLAANKTLYIDLGVLPDYVNDQLAADLRLRRDKAHRVLRVGWRQPLGPTEGTQRTTEKSPLQLSLYQKREGRIDTHVFRPAVLADAAGN